jgi:glycosyltransferase involved in cell wall biosynthesis
LDLSPDPDGSFGRSFYAMTQTLSETSKPTVTVGLPVYNGEQFLSRAIESVLAQTLTDLELVIADNASTDQTQSICQRYAREDSRVRYLRNSSNLGATANFNKLVYAARGSLFKWLASDDYLDPRFLQECVAAMNADQTCITVAPQIHLVGDDGHIFQTIGSRTRREWPTDAVARHNIMVHALQEEDDGQLQIRYTYGLHRIERLRRTRLMGPYIASDNVLATELALFGQLKDLDAPLSYFRLGNTGVYWQNHDFKAIQRIINPRHTGTLSVAISTRRRYLEYFFAVFRSPLSPGEKATAMRSCAAPIAYRLRRGYAI